MYSFKSGPRLNNLISHMVDVRVIYSIINLTQLFPLSILTKLHVHSERTVIQLRLYSICNDKSDVRYIVPTGSVTLQTLEFKKPLLIHVYCIHLLLMVHIRCFWNRKTLFAQNSYPSEIFSQKILFIIINNYLWYWSELIILLQFAWFWLFTLKLTAIKALRVSPFCIPLSSFYFIDKCCDCICVQPCCIDFPWFQSAMFVLT